MRKSRYTKKYGRLLQLLREARERAGLTQGEVAHRFGAYASFVSKVESGERRLDVVELAEFCDLYGIRLASLLEQAGII